MKHLKRFLRHSLNRSINNYFPQGIGKRVIICFILFSVTLIICISSFSKNKQLQYMDGMSEDYFQMGWNIFHTGVIYPDDPSTTIFYFGKDLLPVFRPPGYPFFIAGVLRLTLDVPSKESGSNIRKIVSNSFKIVYLSQAVLFGLTVICFFLWLSLHLDRNLSFLVALLLASNCYLVILTGILHYEILHLFLTVLSCYYLDWCLQQKSVRYTSFFIAGIFWGGTTLTRPMTLIIPFFAVLIFIIYYFGSYRKIIKITAVFTLGMFTVISPYTIRNYVITKKVIPINAQGGVALWAGTSQKLGKDPNYFRWWNLWYQDGMPIFRQITEEKKYSYYRYVKNILQLENAFKKIAIENIKKKPSIFFYNVINNFSTFALDINSVMIKIFEAIQKPDIKFDRAWLEIGNPQDFYHSTRAIYFKYFVYLITLLSFIGIGLSIRTNKSISVAGLSFLCFGVAHAITHMDFMYYYIKLPFLLFLSAFFLNYFQKYQLRILPQKPGVSVGILCAMFLLLMNLTLSVTVLYLNNM